MDKRLILILVVIAFVLFNLYSSTRCSREGFSEETPVVAQESQQIVPVAINNDTHTLMSGSQFIQQDDIIPAWGEYDDADVGEGVDDLGLRYSMCSKSCCSNQYPTPFDVPTNEMVCNSDAEFVPNNMTCNNSMEDSGCLCLTKKQLGFLANRGGNA
jgi:hypothetical protein